MQLYRATQQNTWLHMLQVHTTTCTLSPQLHCIHYRLTEMGDDITSARLTSCKLSISLNLHTCIFNSITGIGALSKGLPCETEPVVRSWVALWVSWVFLYEAYTTPHPVGQLTHTQNCQFFFLCGLTIATRWLGNLLFQDLIKFTLKIVYTHVAFTITLIFL